MRKWLIGLLMILGLCAGFAQAETYVVAVDGTGDFQTLTEAAAASSTGDTILLRAGVYGEQETFPIALDMQLLSRARTALCWIRRVSRRWSA